MMKKYVLFIILFLISSLALAQGFGDMPTDKASKIRTSTANFDGQLSSSDTSVQAALDTLDDLDVSTAIYTQGGWTTDDIEADVTVYWPTYNVGIGSATPRAKLDVDGPIYGTVFHGDGSKLTGIVQVWTDGTEEIYPTDLTDNVGIGTSVASARLDVENSDALNIDFNTAPVGGVGGCDSNTSMLLHFDGADGSTTITDENCSGSGAKTITAYGSAVIDEDLPKFGSTLLLTGGAGTYLKVNDHADLDLGSGDWTFDFWIRPDNITSQQYIVQRTGTVAGYYNFHFRISANATGGVLSWNGYSGMTVVATLSTPTGSISSGAWQHVAVERYGNLYNIYVNGTSVANTTDADSYAAVATSMYIGSSDGTGNWLDGSIDEFRFSKFARYQGNNFTPESAQYDDGSGIPNISINLQKTGVTAWSFGLDGDDGDKFKFGTTAPETGTVYTIDAGNIGIGTNPTERLSVDGSAYITGNLGIQDTTPDAALDVVAPIMVSSTSEGDGDYLIVDGDGNVGIGTASPVETLDLAGDFRFYGDRIRTDRYLDSTTNTFLGWDAVGNGTLVNPSGLKGLYNTVVGRSAMNRATEAYSNVIIGYQAAYYCTTCYYNVLVGTQAGTQMTSARQNMYMGYQAGFQTTSGRENMALGYLALWNNQTGISNSAIGTSALYNTTGSYNIGVGDTAGDNITSGSRNIVIGAEIDAPSSTGSNQLSIGNIIFGTGLDGTGTTISSGNIGIGTAVMTHKLEVDGSFYAGGTGGFTEIGVDGAVYYYGEGSGVVDGSIYGYNANETITISGTGIANKVQVTSFAANGLFNNTRPDHTNDHITIDIPGKYFVSVSVSIESVGGSFYLVGLGLWTNNGTTKHYQVHTHRALSGGGADAGSASMSGIVDLNAGDTVEVWVYNETNTNDVIVDDITLSLFMLNGT